jgi:hypothetical protein
MPTSYAIDAGKRLVRSRAWGVFSAAELIEHYRSLSADPAFDSTYSQLGDLRDVERFDLEEPMIGREALNSIFAPKALRALVAPAYVGYGLARIYSAYAELVPQNIRVFRELAEAEQWLGLAMAESGRR